MSSASLNRLSIESQNAVLKERHTMDKNKIKELKKRLSDANQHNENLMSVLEYLKTFIPKETRIKDLALDEINRKEDVIQYKDMKATRLINIIREKNDIINNLKRRSVIGKKSNLNQGFKIYNADNDKNWRLKN